MTAPAPLPPERASSRLRAILPVDYRPIEDSHKDAGLLNLRCFRSPRNRHRPPVQNFDDRAVRFEHRCIGV